MNKSVYGVSINGSYVDVSRTERGVKVYATRNGYGVVYERPNSGYHVFPVAERVKGKWINL